MKRRYFDWAATALPDQIVNTNSTVFGNPSSQHEEGRLARELLEKSRARCAAALGVKPEQLYFTSGGTEANALVLHSLLLRRGKPDLVFSAAEHPSIRENAETLSRLGKGVFTAAVEKYGAVSPRGLTRALEKADDPRLLAVMGVNNETGALTDIPALAEVLLKRGGAPVHFHCDMVQHIGKIPADITRWNIDSASFSAHKLGGPRGIGLLYLKKPLDAVLYAGGGQENGIRPGTENTAGAAALADCLEKRARPETVIAECGAAGKRMGALIRGLKNFPRCSLIPAERGEEDPRFSPWILQLAFAGLPGEVMVRTLDEAGFAASTGSACSSAKKERPVLAAMGLDEKTAFQGLRFSQGWSTTVEDIDALLETIADILKKI